ncbi:MFS domain-containing histidine kinase [Psychrobacillus sp. FSL W7-1493]|uniref:sensor histidine kinase n=1 Tax=Psychrobacillus sp. FSL W7-1493 TaxID=2921552 RepID=UPI0030FB216D
MKRPLGKVILLSVLVVIAVGAFITLTNLGREYIGKNYFDSSSFQQELDEFESALVPLALAVPDIEAVKKNIVVTSSEIEEHRNRYGNLEDQIYSIERNYEDRINSATMEETSSEGDAAQEKDVENTVRASLIAERDAKIADIKKNFESDEHVEDKIRKEKEEEVDAYFQSVAKAKNHLLNEKDDFNYELKNVETGEVFTNGTIGKKMAFKKVYSSDNGYLKEPNTYSPAINEDYYDGAYRDLSDTLGSRYTRFEGTIAISEASMLSGNRSYEYNYFKTRQLIFYSVIVVGILSAVLFVFQWRKNRKSFIFEKGRAKYESLPIDVQIVLTFVSGFLAILFAEEAILSVFHYGGYDIPIGGFIIAVILTAATLYQIPWLKESLSTADWKNSLTVHGIKSLEGFFLNRSIGVQTIIMLIVVFFWGVGTVLIANVPELIILWIPCTLFIGIPVLFILLSRMAYLNRIIGKTEEMVKGNDGSEIKVKGRSPIAKLASNVNDLRGRVQTSQIEQVKSERLKTELITNVSHDLRTPLTSIITYTDLLKNPDITEEERASYIAILDKKSLRLKTLIEDLFEVSKMASGNMELDKRKVDLTQLLQQAVAEHQEDIDKSGLDYRVTIGTKPIMSYVDGQKWWRVLDNLIINTLKYSLLNTRVYINLDQSDGHAVFVFKNIAKYELGDDVAELTERFKRADTSRHTEGSGLGLAIAQSIVDLHGGSLVTEVDGDLFKVTVKIPVI